MGFKGEEGSQQASYGLRTVLCCSVCPWMSTSQIFVSIIIIVAGRLEILVAKLFIARGRRIHNTNHLHLPFFFSSLSQG